MSRRRKQHRDAERKRRRLAAIPAVVAVLLLAALAAGAGLAAGRPAPSDTPPAVVEPTLVTPTSPATPTQVPSPVTLHRYADKDETAFITSCIADAPANTVPAAIAQAFCVCTLNAYETTYPTYDAMNAARASGALTEQMRTQISDRCVQAILGG